MYSPSLKLIIRLSRVCDTGEKAKEIFVKSKLPFDKLGAIWNLADTKSRGKLDLTDFIIGMHFIQSTMNGTLTTIPASLPAGLYEKAAGGSTVPQSPSGLTSQNTGGSTGYLSRQMTGANQFSAPNTPLRSNLRSPPPSSGSATNFLQAQRTGSTFAPANNASAAASWAVTPTDKAKSDRFFDGLDQDRQGVLEGQAAVPFFMQSGLNEVTLAHIWDLSDITQSGSLSKDEFAVAMHLINLKITGSDLPQELPSSLVPPSLRGTNLPQAVNPADTDTQRDLFSLMDDDVDLPVSAASASAFAAPAVTNNTHGQARSAFKPSSGPFDDDFLGSTAGPTSGAPAILSPTMTGASTMSGARSFTPQATGTATNQMPFGDASAEVANQRLALDSTQKSLGTLETKKAELERSVTSDAAQIKDLTTRLETVRMRHQTESEAVKALTERHAAQVQELKTLREESVREESELSRLRAEKDEIEQSLMKDREDVREMKRVVGEKTKLKEELKVELEKLKKDARMQKGLVAIGKKQLSQAEGEVSSAQGEVDQARAGNLMEEERQVHAEHGEVTMSPRGESLGLTRDMTGTSTVKSPSASVRSNNPFDRLPAHAGGAAATGAAAGLASAAGIGAAVAHHGSSSDAATTRGIDNDPFGATSATQGNVPVETTAAAAPSTAFDDSFANFDSATAAVDSEPKGQVEPSQGKSAFDDAFADLDEPASVPATALTGAKDEEEVPAPVVPGSFEAAGPDATMGETSEPLGVETIDDREHVRAPTVDEVQSDADVTAVGPSADKGKAPLAAEEDDLSSEEEEEEPEDVEQTTARRLVDSPDEVGEGKGLGLPVGDATSRPAESAIQAANRFPELNDADLSTTSKAPIPASDALNGPTSAFASISSAVPPTTSGFSMGRTPSAPNSDAFHDAYSDAHDTRGDAESAAGSGFAAITGHDRYTTALDNDDSTLQSAGSSKVRRAPPPAPSRGATLASPPLPANLGPFANLTAANTSTSAAPKDAGLDDFDAAFEDLGPTSQANGTTGNTSTSSSMPGFEDAFGDADDFDFVPSFHDAPTSLPATNATSNAAPHGGFDGFGSAFDSAFDPAANVGKGVNSTTARSATGSGFSFEDAFAPLESNVAPLPLSTGGAPPASVSSGAPPSLPARAPTGNTTVAPPTQSTGALPDDAAPVRQLCAMGFSRSDVIKSLEKSNYRTDKALEKLLAQA